MSEAIQDLVATIRHGCSTCRTGCKTTDVPDLKKGDGVVVRTERGVEYALILTAPEPVESGATLRSVTAATGKARFSAMGAPSGISRKSTNP